LWPLAANDDRLAQEARPSMAQRTVRGGLPDARIILFDWGPRRRTPALLWRRAWRPPDGRSNKDLSWGPHEVYEPPASCAWVRRVRGRGGVRGLPTADPGPGPRSETQRGRHQRPPVAPWAL